MAGVFGEFSHGPIQFGSGGAIESRGTADRMPSTLSGPTTPTTAPAPGGGGSLGGIGGGGGGGPSIGAQPTGPNPEWGMPGGAIHMPVSSGGATNNGGGYGLGGIGPAIDPMTSGGFGGGGPDGGGTGTDTGVVAYDEGGEVEEDGALGVEQGAQSATIDPMQAITKTLQYGRKKMGLPQNFSTGDMGSAGQQSFDEGGEVEDQGVLPEQGVTAGGNNPGPDPRKALQYLTGAGNVSPDIAGALEQHVDPQGAMSPAHRTIAAIAHAPSPDAAFGMLQHYRTKYNAYSGGARAALDQGNLAQAAVHATNALAAMPTGYDVRFAPAKGGVAMSAKKLGPKAKAPAMEDGGEVSEEWGKDLPESGNIEDRRENDTSITTAKQMSQNEDNNHKNSYEAGYSGVQDDVSSAVSGRKTKQKAYADGGEVDDEDGDNTGVIPETPAPVEEAQAPLDQAQEVPSPEPQEQPVVLSPQQLKQVLEGGFDKPLDEGWSAYVGKILNAVNPVSTANAGEANEGSGFRPGSLADRWLGKGGAQAQPASPAVTGDVQPNSRWQPTPSIMEALKAQRDEDATTTNVPKTSATQQQAQGKGDMQRPQQPQAPAAPQQPQTGDQRMDAYQRRVEQMANKLYPWASQEDQRNHYVQQMMSKSMESEFKIDQEGAKNKGALEMQRHEHSMEKTRLQQNSITDRQGASLAQKREQLQKILTQKDQAGLMNFIRSESNSLRAARPNITPEEITKELSKTYGVSPNMVQQGGQQQGGTQPAAAQNPQFKQYNGKTYRRGPNGEAIEVTQ